VTVNSEPGLNFREWSQAIRSAGTELLRVLEETEDHEGHFLVPYVFLRKCVRLLGAVDELIDSGFEEEAQILARVLVETRIDFEYFLLLAKETPEWALARVIDAKMLEKLKVLKAVDFKFGDAEINREKWQQIEEEIRGRHTDGEIEELRRHGFSGMPLEARAVKTGNKKLYDLAYRLYSGHTHATEIHEHLRWRLVPEFAPELEKTLLPAVQGIVCDCVATVVRECNRWAGNPLGISD